MMIRNSLKSIFRTPVKTVLFTLLIAAVTVFLYLGLNTFVSGLMMMQDCDENYTTIVTLEYQEEYGVGNMLQRQKVVEEVDAIDFEALTAAQYLLHWQPLLKSAGVVEGFTTGTLSKYSNHCVLIVTGLRPYLDGTYHGEVVESLYSLHNFRAGLRFFMDHAVQNLGFVPDPNEMYIIIGKNTTVYGASGGKSHSIIPVTFSVTADSGYDFRDIPKVQRIESAEDFHAIEDNPYEILARYLDLQNNALTICRAAELSTVKEFHQDYLILDSGRLFTKEESDRGEKLCVISKTVAAKLNAVVGDSINTETIDGEKGSYTIVGIVAYQEDYHLNVYISSSQEELQPIGYGLYLGEATIQNGKADQVLAQLKTLLPENIYATVYDQGYQTTADSLSVILKASGVLTIIALAVTFAVLAFFAYQFSDARRETVEIMRCFGTNKNQVRQYLMPGITLISFIAIWSGVAIATRYAESLIRSAYTFVSELKVVDVRFSDGYRGVVKEFTPIVTLSYGLAIAAGVGIFALAVALCLYYAEKTISGRLITPKAKARILKEPGQSSVAFSGWLRHAILSIRRSGIRSALIPLLSAAALLFVSSLQATLASYDTARENLYGGTQMQGYFAQMSGKPSNNLHISNTAALEFLKTENMDDIAYTYLFDYDYRGKYEDDTWYPEIAPSEEYFSVPGKLIFTNSVAGAPEFINSNLHCEFMSADLTMERFLDRNWNNYHCILSQDFMLAHDLKLGDLITLKIEHSTFGFTVSYDLEMSVVGSFTQISGKSNIYCPLPLGALNPEHSSLRLLSDSNAIPKTGNYVSFARRELHGSAILNQPISLDEFMRDYFTPDYFNQQYLDMILDAKSISSLTFYLSDAYILSQVKDAFEEAGYSGYGVNGGIRNFIVIQDSQFNETNSSISQRSKYLQILYPVFLVLVCILGVITGYLSINSRREDIALMRGLGVRKRQIFSTIFGEQLLLLLVGLIPAALAWLVLKEARQLTSVAIYGFFLCYVISSALAMVQQNAKKALAILSEKE